MHTNSLSHTLDIVVRSIERAVVLRSEREASIVDADCPDIMAEEQEWETVLGDGID